MRTQDLIKRFQYDEEHRVDLSFSDATKIYLESRRTMPGVRLRPDSSGDFPTTGEHYVRHRVTEPLALDSWRGFDVEAVVPDGTALSFRLSDGTDDYWWDGGAWAVAGAGEWSTQAEIHANAASFRAAVSTRKLQVVTRLSTTDPSFTPRLTATKLLMRVTINFSEDLVLRSLVPTLKESIRPRKDWSLVLASATDTIDISSDGDHPVPSYVVTDVLAAYNHTTDPEHETDILSSYDEGTGVVTLTAAQSSGDRIWLALEYRPGVAVATHPDYYEVDAIPSIVVESLRPVGRMYSTRKRGDAVIDRTTGDAVRVGGPVQVSFEVDLMMATDRNSDRLRLGEAVMQHFDEAPLLNLRGVDEPVATRVTGDLAFTGRPEGSGVVGESLTVRFDRVDFWPTAEDRHAVQTFAPDLATA